MASSINWKDKLRAAGVHLGISLCVAALAAALVFGVWYPYPYSEISRGRELFMLVTAVDVVLGPLMTLVVYNRAKSRREKWLDFGVIGLLQLAALAYGLWTVAAARPVHLVFEVDRYRAVHAVDVPHDMLPKAPAALQTLPLTGPTLIGMRRASGQEVMEVTMAELGGLPAAARPDMWVPYDQVRDAVRKKLRPAGELATRFPARADDIARAVGKTGATADQLGYLPVAAKKDVFWTALVRRDSADVVGFIPLDSF